MLKFVGGLINKIRNKRALSRKEARAKVERLFKFKYTCFKDLLSSNAELLNVITDLEIKLRGQEPFGMSYVRSQATRSVFHTLRMVKALDDLSNHKYQVLFAGVDAINEAIKEELGKRKELPVTQFVLAYSEITKEMIDWVGGKNANLGELKNRVDIAVPEGFAITTRAYEYFIDTNNLVDEIQRLRMHIDPNDLGAITSVSEKIQELIIRASVPAELEREIMEAYADMVDRLNATGAQLNPNPTVAMRSSAIGEDSELSYAGQYLSILNVPVDKIMDSYKFVLASLYTPRAMAYRLSKGMRDEDIAMSVACIEMVNSYVSGVMYSRDPVNILNDKVLINAVCGLGPYAVDGTISPDTYVVSKDDSLGIEDIRVSHKPVQLIMNPTGGLAEIAVPPERQDAICIAGDTIKILAGYALKLEKHYQYPQDVEWAMDDRGRLMVLQARPLHLENVQPHDVPVVSGYEILLDTGVVAYPGVGVGRAFHVRTVDDLVQFPDGAVLVARHSDPEYVLVMRKAAAIVTDAGSVTGHMAALAREFGIPSILDTKSATADIEEGEEITVDAYSRRIYLGKVDELLSLQTPRVSAMKDTPVYETLRRVCDLIVPLNLINPRSENFTPEGCETLHDIMRYVHEMSYKEMFRISDLVSDTDSGSLQLRAPIPLDLHLIDIGGGTKGVSDTARFVEVDQIASTPFKALMRGMLHEDLRSNGPRPIDLGGFFSVFREQMLSSNNLEERFGDRSYAIVSDVYLNFSSRIGYHYSVLDSYCGDAINKNYITFSFKGGAADELRRNRRVRAIAKIFEAMGFQVDVREDRVDARFYKYDQATIEQHLDQVGRLLQYTRQMDMLMMNEDSVEKLAKCFLAGQYQIDPEVICRA